MKILGFVSLGLAEIAFVTASCLWFHRRGFSKGREEGFAHGHDCGIIDGQKWWMQAEVDVQAARESIWKAEG